MSGSRKRRSAAGTAKTGEMTEDYSFAVQEYRHTVAPSTSNDDGMSPEFNRPTAGAEVAAGKESAADNTASLMEDGVAGDSNSNTNSGTSHVRTPASAATAAGGRNPPLHTIHERDDNDMAYNLFHSESDEASTFNFMFPAPSLQTDSGSTEPEAAPTDAMYEEQYGDAYVGAPLKYVYPLGYQSMRPRSGPWKLSIVICILFASLSVYTVRHCADQAETNGNGQNGDDQVNDELEFVTRWCNSRGLYFVWVVNMLVTGLSAAYCCIIGYIKVRDFSVANCRSQPPGMVGKSDYYVQIRDVAPVDKAHGRYHKTIYQEDGTPQFWGGHIYRPTQAAVAVTSR